MSDVLSAALEYAKVKEQQAKYRAKAYADQRSRASPSDIKTGDRVLLKQARQTKMSTRYDSRRYRVIERSGSSLILQRGEGRVLMRNVSQAHKLHRNIAVLKEDDFLMGVDLPYTVESPRTAEQDVRTSVRVRREPTYLKDHRF